jgi:hypothetical protein
MMESKMKFKSLAVGLLSATMALGPLASPALADGGASTRNILLGVGAAVGLGVTNYNHKKRIKEAENQQEHRRQASYRQYFYNKYGYYPSESQYREWYYRNYGVNPSST